MRVADGYAWTVGAALAVLDPELEVETKQWDSAIAYILRFLNDNPRSGAIATLEVLTSRTEDTPVEVEAHKKLSKLLEILPQLPEAFVFQPAVAIPKTHVIKVPEALLPPVFNPNWGKK